MRLRYKTLLRMERAIALELLGRKDRDIAAVVGLTPKGLESLKTRREYRARRAELTQQLLSWMDAVLMEGYLHPGRRRGALAAIENPTLPALPTYELEGKTGQ